MAFTWKECCTTIFLLKFLYSLESIGRIFEKAIDRLDQNLDIIESKVDAICFTFSKLLLVSFTSSNLKQFLLSLKP